ncbi:MAG TPA: hypothetical protein VJ843_05095, partial [Candidatus Saccharimonadales bacterium]|nr:hypothetical protein [Candidatus Saccharimonadales bacterium]
WPPSKWEQEYIFQPLVGSPVWIPLLAATPTTMSTSWIQSMGVTTVEWHPVTPGDAQLVGAVGRCRGVHRNCKAA